MPKMGCIQETNKNKFNDNLETDAEYKERWRSIYIIYFTMFLISLGFSIIIAGVWPYLDKLDPHAGKEFMSFIVAANPFAQMLFSTPLGWWTNKLKESIRIPLLTTLALYTIASALYSSLELFDGYHKYWMLFSRFLVGVSSANIAACRSYLSAATRLSERTQAVSMISLAQVIGFVIGPALQAAVVPLGDTGYILLGDRLHLNMYTAAGWINVVLSTANFVLFLPYFFKEHRIAKKEEMKQQGVKSEEDFCISRPDYFSAWTLIVAFFVLVFNFMLLETLGTSLIMDQFALTKALALTNMGILMSIGGVVSIICFLAINPLCKRFPEIKVMIWGGFFFMVLGRAVYIPWGDDTPIMYDDSIRTTINKTLCDNYNNGTTAFLDLTTNNATLPILPLLGNFQLNDNNVTLLPGGSELTSLHSSSAANLTDLTEMMLQQCSEVELVGCPTSQHWCTYTRAMTLFQFILGFAFTVIGYPIGVTLIQTIFTKVLGSKPQGIWMGLLTSAGCMSRVLGPVCVTSIYTMFGTVWTFAFTTVMMAGSMVWLVYFADRVGRPRDVVAPAGDENGRNMEMDDVAEPLTITDKV